MTIAELKPFAYQVKRLLNLSNYTLSLRWMTEEEVTENQSYGLIWISDDYDFLEVALAKSCGKYTHFWLIHELIHAVLHGLGKDGSDSIEERVVNRFARIIARQLNVPVPPTPWKLLKIPD
jgi:ssRNA-specific RNase YbeY (16S rRNA maturation enzyme)